MFVALLLQFGRAQETPPPSYYRPNQQVSIDDLPSVKAQSKDAGAVLLAAVQTVLHDKDLCCGRDSALVDEVASADPSSLQSLSLKLQGRQHLSDGRPVMVTAEYLAPSAIGSGEIVGSLRSQHALLMLWNAHVYVLYGATFDETYDGSGAMVYAIRKLLLLDPRFSGKRRAVSFNRDTDDFGKVQGMLLLTTAPPLGRSKQEAVIKIVCS